MKDPIKNILKELEKNLTNPQQLVKDLKKRETELKRFGEQANKVVYRVNDELKKLQGFLDSLDFTQLSTPLFQTPKAKSKTERSKKKSSTKVKATTKPRRTTNTEKVLNLIYKSEDGISIEEIVKKTKLKKPSVYNAVKQLKKAEKISSPKRGVYKKK